MSRKLEIELIISISKDLGKDWSEDLYAHNLHRIFDAISHLKLDTEDINRIVCFIVYAYHPDSKWLNIKKDRVENKLEILNSLAANTKSDIFKEVLEGRNETISSVIFDYLENLKDWRWKQIFELADFCSKISRFANQETEEEKEYTKDDKDGNPKSVTKYVDVETIAKVNKYKGELLDQVEAKRKKIDDLLELIRKDYIETDHATQTDFGFALTDTSKKRDPLKWRDYIKEVVIPLKKKSFE